MSPQRKQMKNTNDESSPDKLNSLKMESSNKTVDESSKKIAPMKTLADRKSTVRLGTLVWGKLDKWPWWPGLIISHEDVGLPVVKKQGSYYILWFGPTKTVSEMAADKLSDFLDMKLNALINQPKQNSVLQKAIGEALRALSQTQQDQRKLINASFTKLKSWAIQLLAQKEKLKISKQVVLDGIPSWLEKAVKAINATNKRLKKISQEKKEAHLAKKIKCDSKLPTSNNNKIKIEKVEVEEDDDDEEMDESVGPRDADIALVERIKCGSLDVENFCLGCHTEIMGPCMEHPLFFGGLCYGDCKMELLKTSYGIGEDSIHVSCAVCGSTGKCLICDKESCSRVYCPYCVELMVGQGSGDTIMQQSPWMCFLCTPYSKNSHGLLKARPNWPIRLRNFLHPNVSNQVSRHWMKNSSDQPTFRVVVLHDNLGSVEFALRQLGLKPNQYWGSDRWENISEMNSIQFQFLENINEWDDQKLSTLCPVDLLVSCLPVVQHKRKVTQAEQSENGETSATTSAEQQLHNPTGKQVGRRLFAQGAAGEAFLHFDRIRWSILRHNGSTPLLWAVENVSDYHMWISRNLEMEPMIFTVKDRQNVSQSRLVWTNIPEDFTKKQLDDEKLMSDYSSTALGPRSREPFFVKYPWILEDIIACNQEIPASWLERKKRERFQRETRIRTKTLKPNNYVQLSGASETPSSSDNAPRKKKTKDPLMAWKCPGIDLMSSSDEEEDATDFGEELADLRSYFHALGFPILFTDYAVKLPKAAVVERLNGCLPISLWMKIFTPLVKFMPTSNVDS